MPKCTIIPDKDMKIKDIVDIVRQNYKKDNIKIKKSKKSKSDDIFEYDVRENVSKDDVKTCPLMVWA